MGVEFSVISLGEATQVFSAELDHFFAIKRGEFLESDGVHFEPFSSRAGLPLFASNFLTHSLQKKAEHIPR